MKDIFQKLLIIRTPGIGPVKYQKIIDSEIELNHAQEHIEQVRREMARAAELGIHYICKDSKYYPEALRRVAAAPPVITVRGNLETLRLPAVAIVGTRHATAAALRFTSDMAREFATRGTVVVSGMAIGTDTAAHMGALAASGDSQTIAVLAGGADYIWPLENERLYHQILERGCVVSEMPVGTVPVPNNFIQRNRWIAGLSDKLILGEADEKSGSMATARFAIDYGRQVYAIPGHPSDERSRGPNRLIKDGHATLCMGVEDFFPKEDKKHEPRITSTSHQNEVLNLLGNIPIHESVLAELAKKTVADIRRELVMLELSGAVRKTVGGYVKA